MYYFDCRYPQIQLYPENFNYPISSQLLTQPNNQEIVMAESEPYDSNHPQTELQSTQPNNQEIDISNKKRKFSEIQVDCDNQKVEGELLPEIYKLIIEKIVRYELRNFVGYPNSSRYGFHPFKGSTFIVFESISSVCRAWNAFLGNFAISSKKYRDMNDPEIEKRLCLLYLNLRRPDLDYFDKDKARSISNETISKLTNLIHLNLHGEPTSSVIKDGSIKDLVSLTSLNLGQNHSITDEGIRYLTNLTSLDLYMNRMITDEGLTNLKNLTYLDLSQKYDYNITSKGIKSLTTLRALNLEGAPHIGYKALENLTNLTILNINDSALANYSYKDIAIIKLTNLTYLSMKNNVSIGNEGVSHLVNLTELDISLSKWNEKSSLTDDGIRGLTNLTKLNLCYNENITLEMITSLQNLKTVCLYGRKDHYTFRHPTLKTYIYFF